MLALSETFVGSLNRERESYKSHRKKHQQVGGRMVEFGSAGSFAGAFAFVRQAWREAPMTGANNREAKAKRELTWR